MSGMTVTPASQRVTNCAGQHSLPRRTTSDLENRDWSVTGPQTLPDSWIAPDPAGLSSKPLVATMTHVDKAIR